MKYGERNNIKRKLTVMLEEEKARLRRLRDELRHLPEGDMLIRKSRGKNFCYQSLQIKSQG